MLAIKIHIIIIILLQISYFKKLMREHEIHNYVIWQFFYLYVVNKAIFYSHD